jgi:hypothetical protein
MSASDQEFSIQSLFHTLYKGDETMKHQRTIQFAVAIVTILSMMFGLATPRSVYAAEPPPPPTGGNDLGGEQPVASPAPEESAPPEETVVDETVVDAPVTSAEDADLLGVDELHPISVQWCPTGVPSGGSGCVTYSSIEALIADIDHKMAFGNDEHGPPQQPANVDGTIWVSKNYNSGDNAGDLITFDADTFMDTNLTLAMIGGVNFSSGLVEDSNGGPTLSTLNQPLFITNFGHEDSFTLANFILFNTDDHDSLIFVEGGSPPSYDTIKISDSENVTLTNLQVNNTGNKNGILIEDSSNVKIEDVKVTESGDGAGIAIQSGSDGGHEEGGSGGYQYANSNITLEGVEINEEGEGSGIYAESVDGLTLEDVKVTGEDQGDAISIFGSKDLAFEYVDAKSENFGLYVDGSTTQQDYLEDGGSSSLWLSIEHSDFSNNGDTGVFIINPDGNVQFEDVVANENGNQDQESLGGPPQQEDPTSGSGIVILGDVKITLEDVVASGNAAYGAYFDGAGQQDQNDLPEGDDSSDVWLSIEGSGSGWKLALEGFGEGRDFDGFSGNGNTGIFVANAAGDLKFENVIANDNGDNGDDNHPLALGGGNDNDQDFTDGSGIFINSEDNIFFENVTASGNEAFGAYINGKLSDSHDDGLLAESSAPWLWVEESEFNENGSTGLYVINTAGEVMLADVDASENGSSGGDEHRLAFGGNDDPTLVSGIFIKGEEDIFMEKVTANENKGYGAYIDGSDSEDHDSLSTETYSAPWLQIVGAEDEVGLSALGGGWDGYSEFSENGNTGLFVVNAAGDVSLEDVLAEENGGDSSEENYGLGHGNDPTFGSGIVVLGGVDVTMEDVIASDNEGFGAYVVAQSDFDEGSGNGGEGNVSIEDSEFNENGATGLYVDVDGFIKLSDVKANENEGDGADLRSMLEDAEDGLYNEGTLDSYSVWMEDVTFNMNHWNGVEVKTLGGIFVDVIQANGNGEFDDDDELLGGEEHGGSGAVLDNYFESAYGCESDCYHSWGNIYVTNTNTGYLEGGEDTLLRNELNGNAQFGMLALSDGDIYIDNSIFGGLDEEEDCWEDWLGNGWDGLLADAVGDVTVHDSEAYNNGWDGMHLYSDAEDSVYVSYVTANYNMLNGVEIYTPGNVYVNVIDASYNGWNGLYVDNCLWDGYVCTGVGNVNVVNTDSVNWWNDLSDNGWNGMEVYSGGYVYVNFTWAEDNAWDGIYIYATGDVTMEYVELVANGDNGANLWAGGDVDIMESAAYWNYDDGIQVGSAGGDVFVEEVDSFENGGDGLDIWWAEGDVTIWDSHFTNNDENGILTYNDGDVFIDLVTASGNGYDGLYVYSGGDVTVDDSMFIENDDDGMDLQNFGDMFISFVDASSNEDDGADLDSDGIVNVTSSSFNANLSDGMDVEAWTGIVLDNVAAFNNTDNGASLFTEGTVEVYDSFFGEDHDTAMDGLGVWVLGTNPVDWGNGGAGLYIEASGTVYLENVMADKNYYSGMDIQSESMITILDSDADSNGEDNPSLVDVQAGVYIHDTTGQVYIEDLIAGHNDYGLFVDTTRSVTVVGNMTGVNGDIFGTQFTNNLLSGMVVYSGGTINLFQVESSNNDGDGAELYGSFIHVESSEFNHNGGWGLRVDAVNSITFLKVTACYNTVGPYVLMGGALTINESEFCDDTSDLPEDDMGMYMIVNVYTDVNVGAATLKSNYGVIFIYLKKNADGTPGDVELARVTLAAGIVPDGTIGTFRGLAEGDVPAGFSGTFGGTSFEFTLVGPDGVPMSSIPGTMQVRFTVQPDRDYAILWYDAVQQKWFELPTTISGPFAYASSSMTGVFMVVAR